MSRQPLHAARTAWLAPLGIAMATAAAGAARAADDGAAPPPVPLPHCDAPIASVMVGKLACKATGCQAQASQPSGVAALIAAAQAAQNGIVQVNAAGLADGIKDVLVTALSETGCFDVQDREQLDEINEELKRAGKTIQAQQADFLVSGAITQIEVSAETKSWGGGWIPVVGSIGTRTQRAAVALDMRLVSVQTAKVLASKRATASSETSSRTYGAAGAVYSAGEVGGFGGSLASLRGSSLEAVTRDALTQSVVFLVEAAKQAKGSAPAPAVAVAPVSPAR